jgi:glycine cleavage system H protein
VNVPEDRRYTDQHEWVLAEGDTVRIGITDYAQEALGEVVYVDLPEPGSVVAADEVIAEVESTKSVAEVYAPVAGTIVAVNEDLDGAYEHVNDDPYGDGWFLTMRPDDPSTVEALLDAAAYRDLTE